MTRARLSAVATLTFTAIIPFIFTYTASAQTYTTQKGDSLWSISVKHGTSVEAIARANNLSQDAVLPVGKALQIPSASEPRTTANDATSQDLKEVHTRVESVVLRSGPGTNHSKLAVMPAGSTGKVLAVKGNWTKVAFGDGTCGYMHNPLLSDGAGTVRYSAAEPVKAIASAKQSDSQSDLIQTALSLRGIAYRSGGTSRRGFDCSGFTRYVFAKYGISLPHSSAAQARLGSSVARSELKAGDLVFFETYKRGISHVGIYIGGNQFVHAPRNGRTVSTDSLSSGYYASRYRGARRIR